MLFLLWCQVMKLLLIYHFGLFTCCIQWMVDEKELRVIHYTLGPLKPWDWWTSWLLKPVDVWQVLFFLLLRDNWKLYSIRGIDVCIPLWKSNMLWVLNFESHCHISYSSLKCFIANKTINEAELVIYGPYHMVVDRQIHQSCFYQ